METTGRWSNGLGSLNPKYHYEYQEMRGEGGYTIHPHWIHHLGLLPDGD